MKISFEVVHTETVTSKNYIKTIIFYRHFKLKFRWNNLFRWKITIF